MNRKLMEHLEKYLVYYDEHVTLQHLDYQEYKYIEKISQRMLKKSETRVNHIIKRIENNISKHIFNKKYQISSNFEFYKIKKSIEHLLPINYELIIVQDGELQMNKLSKINVVPYNQGYCCRECDKSTFENIKKNVLYCSLSKKKN